MKKIATILLQIAIVLIGLFVLFIMIWLPPNEGRAKNLNLIEIYTDPFILVIYASSFVFFVGLFKAFKLLGNIGQNREFAANSINLLKDIRYCALLLCALIVGAGLYISLFHHKDDDPAGFLAICIVFTFASVLVANITYIFEKKWRKGSLSLSKS